MPRYQQNQASDILADGVYPFRVKNAQLKFSTNGNEMIELTLEINEAMTVYDRLIFAKNSYWKIDQFRIATGEKLGAAGSDADLEAEDCVGRRGEVEIGTDEYQGRTRNQVLTYIAPVAKNAIGEHSPKAKRRDPDVIPF